MKAVRITIFCLLNCLLFISAADAQQNPVAMRLNLADRLRPLEIDRIALGQGGLSDEPMWEGQVDQIRMLHPRLVRLFVQEYFDLMPAAGRYHWDTLDASVDLIRKTGASALMNIDFKPKALFPSIDEKIVEPTSYEQWEQLIYEMVRHYKQRGSGIKYWEISNEPDIGENGGCPYLFTPENYTRYYQHTAAAILRADPDARVGGPALASARSPILPALLDAADKQTPLHFVSWHIYNSDPTRVRETIEYIHGLLSRHPSLHPETILDEWNMALRDPPQDPQFQPAYILETAYQMKDGGLDYSCYYHIRDHQIDPAVFARFMSPNGVALMARWWNRSPQWDGLFDYNGRTRPSYFAFKLLSRLTGDRLSLRSGAGTVHALATYDEQLRIYNVLVWNFSSAPAKVEFNLDGIPSKMALRRVTLDAAAASDDENVRLRPVPTQTIQPGTGQIALDLTAYGITFFSLEQH
jgi:xylan 1,4-beta-xylosidase